MHDLHSATVSLSCSCDSSEPAVLIECVIAGLFIVASLAQQGFKNPISDCMKEEPVDFIISIDDTNSCLSTHGDMPCNSSKPNGAHETFIDCDSGIGS